MTTIVLSKGASIDGVSTSLVKSAARTLWDLKRATTWDLAVALGAPPTEVEPLWRRLVRSGAIAETDGEWRPTHMMFTLATSRLGNPLPRAKASSLLETMVENARKCNDGDEAMFYVVRIAVFGSYLDVDKDPLGDLDVAWQLVDRPEYVRRISNMICVNEDPTSHMRRLVRPRHNAVRLTDWASLSRLKAPFKCVYEFSGPKLDAALEFEHKNAEEARKSIESLASLAAAFPRP